MSGVPEVEQTATDLLTYGEAVEEQLPNVGTLMVKIIWMFWNSKRGIA